MDIATLVIEESLPIHSPRSVQAGRGDGCLCDVCASRIEPADVQYDFSCTHRGQTQAFRMHVICFQEWQQEVVRRAPPPKPTRGAPAPRRTGLPAPEHLIRQAAAR